MSPARLFVIIARDAPTAVILRRGPAAWYHVIRWNMTKDTFEHGAWIKGRIYESHCDLSPDGELLVALVHQGARYETSYTSAWTAVSRAPWLHALALWPQGTTYGGGGRFDGPRELTVRLGTPTTHPDHPADGLTVTGGNAPRHASTVAIEGADWAGHDHAGYVSFTRGGKLFRRAAEGDVELADFNGLTPDPQEAPEWARAPLVAPERPRKTRRRARRA